MASSAALFHALGASRGCGRREPLPPFVSASRSSEVTYGFFCIDYFLFRGAAVPAAALVRVAAHGGEHPAVRVPGRRHGGGGPSGGRRGARVHEQRGERRVSGERVRHRPFGRRRRGGGTGGGRARRGRPASGLCGHACGGAAGGGRHRACRHAARAARVHGERGARGGARRGRGLHDRALLQRGGAVPHERRSCVPQGAGRRMDAASAGGCGDVRERGARSGARGPGRPGSAGRCGGHRGGAGALGAARARAGAAALRGGACAREQRARGRLLCRCARGAFGRRALRRADGGGEPVVRAGHRHAQPLWRGRCPQRRAWGCK